MISTAVFGRFSGKKGWPVGIGPGVSYNPVHVGSDRQGYFHYEAAVRRVKGLDRAAGGDEDDFRIRNQSELRSMATSVTGTRMALGARGSEILLQFLVESTVLRALGGVPGLACGLGGAHAPDSAMETGVVSNTFFLFAAVLFSSLAGIFSAFFPPARRQTSTPSRR